MLSFIPCKRSNKLRRTHGCKQAYGNVQAVEVTHHDDDDGNGGDADDDGVVLDVVHELVIATLEYMTHSSQVHSYMFIY